MPAARCARCWARRRPSVASRSLRAGLRLRLRRAASECVHVSVCECAAWRAPRCAGERGAAEARGQAHTSPVGMCSDVPRSPLPCSAVECARLPRSRRRPCSVAPAPIRSRRISRDRPGPLRRWARAAPSYVDRRTICRAQPGGTTSRMCAPLAPSLTPQVQPVHGHRCQGDAQLAEGGGARGC